MKKLIIALAAILTLTLAACTAQSTMDTDMSTTEPPVTSGITAESTTKPAEEETTTATESPDSTQAPDAPAATSAPAGGTTSRPVTPPATSTPPRTNPPATSTPPPATSMPPPATSTPPPSTPAKPTYTEADYQAIINTIRAYGESKGFIWEESYTFEQGHQYYGRPNLERDGYDGVVNMLKYHCDKIEKDGGICFFKVVKHIYEGNTEFVVLYD